MDNECSIHTVFSRPLGGNREIDKISHETQENFFASFQVEVILNSRPSVADSVETNDLPVIIQSQFLISYELKNVSEPDYTSEKISIRNWWKLVAMIAQSF
ncbi:hypothetical protein NPIL_353451 [Nephila pilipes]|uniref:Uncharacterized protein n=1 Tax=Nephila pilipes TaxID=299642 RepID=A0A8X6P7Y4_NEPPI|nr:hypothetical protein NPIL_353451 [Nephila pilipes]